MNLVNYLLIEKKNLADKTMNQIKGIKDKK